MSDNPPFVIIFPIKLKWCTFIFQPHLNILFPLILPSMSCCLWPHQIKIQWHPHCTWTESILLIHQWFELFIICILDERTFLWTGMVSWKTKQLILDSCSLLMQLARLCGCLNLASHQITCSIFNQHVSNLSVSHWLLDNSHKYYLKQVIENLYICSTKIKRMVPK